MEEYNIVKIEESDFYKLIPLMQNAFGLNVNIDYFKWKFLQNPAGKFIGYIATQNKTNEIAAYYGVIPEKYNINGKQILLYQSCDTMTHTLHRRKGLFQKLAIKCYEDLNNENKLNLYGFGGTQSTPGFLKMGWKLHSTFVTLYLPIFFCYFTNYKNNVNFELNLTNEIIDFIILENNKINTFHKILDKDYIKWKFNNPLFKYFFVSTKKAEEIETLLIYKIENNIIIIIDIFGEKNINKLILFLKNKVVELNLKGVLFYVNKKNRFKLIKFGFLFNPLTKGPLSEKIPFITLTKKNITDWLPTMIEHDAI
jgi:hypothetical protein